MPLARVHGAVVDGVTGIVVLVEVDVAQGLPSVGMVGLAGATVAEARWRVRSAIGNTGIAWPAARITIGLSPADVPKGGTSLDLAIAAAVLVADGKIPPVPNDAAFIGELGLDGAIRPVSGALATAVAAWHAGLRILYVSAPDAGLVGLLPGVTVRPARDLRQLIGVLRGDPAVATEPVEQLAAASTNDELDLADVRGQAFARFGLQVAAAGGHHCALLGAPGVGKSMLARRLVGLLPDLDADQSVEVTALQSLATDWRGTGLHHRPVEQAPHHSASSAAVLGTVRGSSVVPGAITLAHHGVLVLDEAAEFARPCLEGLRQPMETGGITISRVGRQATLPARFQLVLTSNPCPCGHGVGTGEACRCSPMARRRYAERLSGPLLDRVDVRITMTRPPAAKLATDPGESSAVARERVVAARDRAAVRFRGLGWLRNADIPPALLRRDFAPGPDAVALLEAGEHGGRSLRGIDRIARLAWTVADLVGADRPSADHVMTALGLRGADGGWAA